MLSQKLGILDAGGHPENDKKANHDVESSNRHKHDAPPLETACPTTVLGGEGDEAADSLADAKTTVPDTSSGSRLFSGVPLRSNHDKGRRYDSFEHAEQSPRSRHAGKVYCCSRTTDNSTPKNNI